jgi:CDGSH-type Zn-finger protein
MPDPVPDAAQNVTIQARPNGPYLVTGPVNLVDATGKPVALTPGRPVSLCRCGHSTMKPFCDGSHTHVGFKAADPAPV